MAHVLPAFRRKIGRLQTLGEQIADDVVGEKLHAAIGMVHYEPLARTQQFVRDDQRTDGIVAGTSACVANDVGISLGQTGKLRRIQTRVHARQNGKMPRRGHGQFGFFPKR